MKRWLPVFVVASVVFYAGAGFAADFRARTGVNFDWWDSDADTSGYQLAVPVQLQSQVNDFSFGILTAYTYTSVDMAGPDPSLSTLLDTKLNSSYAIIDKIPVDIIVGFDLNLPTGNTDLTQEEVVLTLDPDLVSINNFGEGFNINPTVVVGKGWDSWVAGVGFGYNWRGKYDYSSELDLTDFDPGDVITVTGEVRHFFSPRWNARLFGNYTIYDVEQVGGADFHEQGDFRMVGIGLNHLQDQWDTGFTLRGIFRDKDKFLDSAGNLVTEPSNIHGDEWRADLAFRYSLSDTIAIRSTLEGLWITENGYSSSSPFYIGKRTKVALGVGLGSVLWRDLQGEIFVKGFYMDDDARNLPVPIGSRSYYGGTVMAHLTGIF